MKGALLTRSIMIGTSLGVIVALTGTVMASTAPAVRIAASELRTYDMQEIAVDTNLTTANPFDPAAGGVWAEFRSPSGKIRDIDGFYTLGYDAPNAGVPDGLEPFPQGGPWRVRFAPDEPGRWAFTAYVRDGEASREISRGAFQVEKNSNSGFVRVSKRDPLYFETDNGATFFPIGENMCWYGSGRTSDYETWMRGMKNNGATYIRIWMSAWAFALEWNDTGLGNYMDRQAQAAQLDYVFRLAEKYGIKILLCLNNHGMFSAQTNPEWDGNPFNTANGGPLKKPQNFFTDPQARELFKMKLRYIVSRWGYSTSLFAWELFNEVDLTDGYNSKAITAWHKEMAAYIKSIDPYAHPVTTSFGSPDNDPAVWSLPELDFTQTHFYSMGDTAELVSHYTADKIAKFGKPTLIGEFGLDTAGPESNEFDSEGNHLHIGLWTSAVSGAGGGAMLWWWDHYVDPFDLYHHFGSVTRFVRGIDYAGRKLRSIPLSLTGGEKGFASLIPTLTWGAKPANPTYKVTRSGASGGPVASFLYGISNNKDLRKPPTFDVDLGSQSTMSIGVSTVAKAGARLVVTVDGQMASDTSFPASNADTLANAEIRVSIPAGHHTIVVDDRGTDWLIITGYRWESDDFPGIRGYATAGDGLCLAYITDIRYAIKDIASGYVFKHIEGAEAVLTGLTPGDYRIEFWDPWSGKPVAISSNPGTITVTDDGRAAIKLPAFTKDIALKLIAQ